MKLSHKNSVKAIIMQVAIRFNFFSKPESNQIFPILPDELIEKLYEKFEFYIWSKYDDKNSVARLVCSWATGEDAVDKFLGELK